MLCLSANFLTFCTYIHLFNPYTHYTYTSFIPTVIIYLLTPILITPTPMVNPPIYIFLYSRAGIYISKTIHLIPTNHLDLPTLLYISHTPIKTIHTTPIHSHTHTYTYCKSTYLYLPLHYGRVIYFEKLHIIPIHHLYLPTLLYILQMPIHITHLYKGYTLTFIITHTPFVLHTITY